MSILVLNVKETAFLNSGAHFFFISVKRIRMCSLRSIFLHGSKKPFEGDGCHS